MKNSIKIMFAVALSFVSVVSVAQAQTYTAPTGAPPTNNVAAPINAGATAQGKVGALRIGGAGLPTSPAKLDVVGVTSTYGFANFGTSALGGKVLISPNIPCLNMLQCAGQQNQNYNGGNGMQQSMAPKSLASTIFGSFSNLFKTDKALAIGNTNDPYGPITNNPGDPQTFTYVNVTATPGTVAVGQTSNVVWSSTGAYCMVNTGSGPMGPLGASGSVAAVYTTAGTKTVTVTCDISTNGINNPGTDTAQIVVTGSNNNGYSVIAGVGNFTTNTNGTTTPTTPTPTYMLDVVGNTKTAGDAVINGKVFLNQGGAGNVYGYDQYHFLKLRDGGTNWTTLGDYGGIRFSTGNNSTTITEKMQIAPNGNVGIGTTNPTQKLHVNGSARVQGAVTVGSDGSTMEGYQTNGIVYLGDGSQYIRSAIGQGIRIGTYGMNYAALTIRENTGNVGIGNIIASTKLDIDGQIRIRGGNPGNGKVLTSNADGTATWQTPSATGTGQSLYKITAQNCHLYGGWPVGTITTEATCYWNNGGLGSAANQYIGKLVP